MCGIFAYVGKSDQGAQIVLSGLKKLEYRGYDSWGVAVVPTAKLKTKIIIKKSVGKIGNATVEDLPSSHLALGHTRWATHGGVTKINAHPHFDCTKRFALIHNGIMENYQEIKKELSPKHKFLSETDTEVMIHLIEEFARKYTIDEAVRLAFKKATGLNAIVVLDSLNNQIIACKTGSPLVVTVKNGECFLASDSASLLSQSSDLLFLTDGELAILKDGEITLKNVERGEKVAVRFEHVDWQENESALGKYSHFMLKEIEEQPRVLINTSSSLKEAAKNLAHLLKSKNIYFCACGTSYFASVLGSYFFKKIAGKESLVGFASESLLFKDLRAKKDVVMAVSQSGETIDLIEAVRMVQGEGVEIVGLVNVLGSALYRLADDKVLLGAGPEIGVAATKSFMAQVGFLLLLSYAMRGIVKEGQKLLENGEEGVENVLRQKDKVKLLAKKLSKLQHMFVIGRGLSYPMALECALKIKEVSYVHAEGLAGGELKHGVIALIEKGTPCLVLTDKETLPQTISNAMELKARGAYIIGISPVNNHVFDFWLPVSDLGVATGLEQVVYGQLLGYFMALELGFDPDKPRNLAKSVTVK